MILEETRTYLAIGHVTRDRRPDGSFTRGGTVLYAAATARRFGWETLVLTACDRSSEPPDVLEDGNWHVIDSNATTTFRNESGPSGRGQVIEAVARGIGRDSVPRRYNGADLVHLAPVANELGIEVAREFPKAFRVATLQGWLRKWDAAGIVTPRKWLEADSVLPLLKAAVLSIEDIEGGWSFAESWASKVPVLVVTQDEQGCTVFHEGRRDHIRSRPAQEVDATGAGDVFAAVFFILLFETGDVVRSAALANVAASMSVEHYGIDGIPSRRDVEDYMRRNPIPCVSA